MASETQSPKRTKLSLQGSIQGMGNPLLDISADVDQATFDRYGLKLNNAVLAEEKHLPLYKELVDSGKAEYIAGGATLNSIRVAQWCLEEPGSTSYIGCVGDDSYAQQMRDCCKADGVKVQFHVDKSTPTGTCAVLIKDAERSLCANLAAANKYDQDHLDQKEVAATWQAARITYIAGFFLTVSPPSVMKVAQHSMEKEDAVFCMNLSAPFICEFFAKPLEEALPFVDFIFGNESEAEAWAKSQKLEQTDAEFVAGKLAALPKKSTRPRVAVITQGSKATVVAVNGKVTSYEVPPLAKEKIVDANGAGDAFVGGFIAGLAQGMEVEECVNRGHSCARMILQVSGTKLGKKAL